MKLLIRLRVMVLSEGVDGVVTPSPNKETLVTGAVQDSPSGALRALAEHSSVGSLVARGSWGGSLTPPWTPT